MKVMIVQLKVRATAIFYRYSANISRDGGAIQGRSQDSEDGGA